MNIIDIQDQLKNFSEQQLISEMQMPTGSAPQFLVLGEIKRRKRVRDDFMKREAANQPTVAEEAIAAAGVPQSGVMGMSEAMAPKSTMVQNAVGSAMPQSMRSGGIGDLMPMAEGGLVHAQEGAYFPSTQELYGIYGQESGFGKNLFGSSGEIGPYQILPTTAIMPGFGITSMFPELEAAVARGDYKNAQEAYLANKDAVDEALMSGQKSEGFVKSYLDAAESELGDRNKALLAFNQGIPGTRNFEGDASGTNYVSGVLGNQSGYNDPDREVLPSLLPGVTYADLAQKDQEPGLFSAQASTLNADNKSIVNELRGNRKRRRDGTYEFTQDDKDTMRVADSFQVVQDAIEGNISPESTSDGNLSGRNAPRKELPEKVVLEEEDLADPVIMKFSELSPGQQKQYSKNRSVSGVDLVIDDREKSPLGESLTNLLTPDDVETEGTQTETEGQDKAGPPSPKSDPREPLPQTGISKEIADLQAKLEKDRETDKYLALAQAGLALMSSKEPTLLGAVGEAGISGLTAFREAQDRYQEGVVDLINARAKLEGKGSTFTTNQMIQRAQDLQTMAKDAELAGNPQRARELEIAANTLLSQAGVIGGLSGVMSGYEDQ